MCCMQDIIPTSLLKLSQDNAGRAVKMFAGVQKYMEEGSLPAAASPAKSQRLELVQKLLHQVLAPGRPSIMAATGLDQTCICILLAR